MSAIDEDFNTWCTKSWMRFTKHDVQDWWCFHSLMSGLTRFKKCNVQKKKKMMRFTKPDVQSRRCFQNLISKTDDVFTTLCPGLMRFFKPNVEYIFKNWYPRLKGFWNSILLQVKHGASLYEKVIKKVSEAFRKRTAQENAIKELLRIKSCALIGRVVAYPLEKNHKTLTLRPAKRNVLV